MVGGLGEWSDREGRGGERRLEAEGEGGGRGEGRGRLGTVGKGAGSRSCSHPFLFPSQRRAPGQASRCGRRGGQRPTVGQSRRRAVNRSWQSTPVGHGSAWGPTVKPAAHVLYVHSIGGWSSARPSSPFVRLRPLDPRWRCWRPLQASLGLSPVRAIARAFVK